MPRQRKTSSSTKDAQVYRHPDADLAARPEIGAQAHFKKAKPPTTYRFDSSLAPALEWDGQNPAREEGEAVIAEIMEQAASLPFGVPALAGKTSANSPRQATPHAPPPEGGTPNLPAVRAGILAAAQKLKKLSKPFLNWSGKAERLSFDVPTLPLFVHERLSTKAILETLKSHKRDKQDDFFDALYGFQERPLADQLLRAYEYRDDWVNRLILGDALVVMNSLLRYESLGGQVQMIYVDPPYGVKFGSNFQPFVRKRDVSHNDDADMSREPEMVQAYRDTWELGLHSYLTYLRDRLLLARELLAPSGSVFVQISDENLHHVREVMDEVFGAENLISVITVKKTSSASSDLLPTVSDFLLWYARDKERLKYRQLYLHKEAGGIGGGQCNYVEEPDGKRRPIGRDETFEEAIGEGRLFCHDNLTSQRPPGDFPVEFEDRTFRPGRGYWKTGPEGMEKLKSARRLMVVGNTLRYVRFLNDFPVFPITNLWADTVTSGFDAPKLYVVQTNKTIVECCLLMTTDPGDLVFDPTCGSGTTAYVAEQWGRRWITIDTSRVPLALACQRLLTATFDYYQINPVGTRSTASPAFPKDSRDAVESVPTSEGDSPVAILFGPENGPLSERLVREAWDEAGLKHYSHLYVIGFAIDPKARQFIDSAGKIGIPCTYLQATMDLQMGDLLKNMRSSQIFSVCGLPDVKVGRAVPSAPSGEVPKKQRGEDTAPYQWQVELLGLDTFDPVTMEADHLKADDVPAWLLDTDYNGMVFRVRQAFFPRTSAWENLKKALRVEFEDTVWDHLAGTTSAPFPAGEHGQIAVKVIDPRGNELLVVRKLEEGK